MRTQRLLLSLGSAIPCAFLALARATSNAWRLARRRKPAWVVLDEPWQVDLLPASRGLRALFARSASIDLDALRRLLARLARDRRVRGVIVRPDLWGVGGVLPFVRCDEIAEALLAARRGGLRIAAFAHGLDSGSYVIAAACEKRFLPPLGELRVRGPHLTQLYFKRPLENAGIRADIVKRSEFKGAADPLIEEQMPAPQREALEALLDDVHGWLVARLAELCGLSAEVVRERLDLGPCLGSDAVARGWTDAALYEDELVAALEGAESKSELVPWREARRWVLRRASAREDARVGVLRIEGAIVRGRSRRRALPFLPRTTGLVDFAREVRAARRRTDVSRWLLYVDSPGGDALAADLMHRELLLLARERELRAYLGSMAASGGYYVATAARSITAHPATLTGSIGVIAGKVDLERLLERLGVGTARLERGRFGGIDDWTKPFDAEERALLERTVEAIYARFKQCVADGRALSLEDVERLARGRVWSGSAACLHRLVDRLSSFDACRRAAREDAPVS